MSRTFPGTRVLTLPHPSGLRRQPMILRRPLPVLLLLVILVKRTFLADRMQIPVPDPFTLLNTTEPGLFTPLTSPPPTKPFSVAKRMTGSMN